MTLPPAFEPSSQEWTVPVHRLPHAPAELPAYATPGSAGMDVRAAIAEPMTLAPMARCLVPTGLVLLLPEGLECQVRPRSGLSIRHGITLVNAVGTIDSDYREEVKVPLINLSTEPYTLAPGERIAQLVVAPVCRVAWREVDGNTVSQQARELARAGGFGSTGRH